ncbi:MAG: STAS domain-containing protein [Leptospiraceae bacterium]|nr:STAS domain-containing protein [Leptospiraceae bacterium]
MSDKIDLSSNDFNYIGGELKVKIRLEPHPLLTSEGVIVDMSGDLNLYSTPHVKNILNRLVETAGKSKIYLDLDELKYIDSSGLGAFLSVQSKLMKTGGFIRICSPSRQVTAVLELTKLKSMLKVSHSIDDALNGR